MKTGLLSPGSAESTSAAGVIIHVVSPALLLKLLADRRSVLVAAALFAGNPATFADSINEPIDTVEVRAERLELAMAHRERALTPGGVSIIDIADLRERNVSSLADLLDYVPGVWSASASGNDLIFFSSRGSNLDATDYDMNGIKLLQDGLPVTSADGSNHNRVIDPLSAQFATVARGANAVKYGASTLGGAINFVSPTAHDAAGTTVRINGGSHGQVMSRATFAKVFDNSFDGLLTVEHKNWHGYRDHNEQSRFGIYANGGWQLGDSIATRFYGTYLDNNQELPGSLSRAQVEVDPNQANPSSIGGNFQLDTETWRLANRTTWLIAENHSVDFGFYVEEQHLFHPIVDKVLLDLDGSGPTAPVEVFSLLIDTDDQGFGTMARYDYRIGNHDLLFGLNYGRNSVEGGHFRNDAGRRNGLTTLIDNGSSTLEAFAMDRWKLGDSWTLVLATQIVSAKRAVRSTDLDSGVSTALNDDYRHINPRLGVIYKPGINIELFANVSRLYEPPTTFELQNDVRGGDETLDPMQGLAVEVGSRGSSDFGRANSWMWDLCVYYARIEDEILSVDDPAAPGTSLATNINDTVHAGLEALIGFTLVLDQAGTHTINPLLSLTLNRFYFDGDNTYADNRLPAAPEYLLHGEIMYRRSNGFQIGPTFALAGDRYADFSNTYPLDAYALLGLRAGWRGNRNWYVFAEVQNVLDEDYIATHGVRNTAGQDVEILNPGPPMSIYAGVQLRFD